MHNTNTVNNNNNIQEASHNNVGDNNNNNNVQEKLMSHVYCPRCQPKLNALGVSVQG